MLATLLSISCKKEVVEDTKKQVLSSVPVTVITASKTNYYEYGYYYGRTKGVNRASIINILGGTVESVDVLEGASVKKGDSLGRISHKSAEISLESAILNEKISGDNFRTLSEFLKSGNSTPKSVDQAKLAWLSSQSQLINAQKAYDSSFCISPIDGVVVNRYINIDDEVFQGQTTFLIENLNEIEIEIGIPEADMKGVKEGSKALVSMDLFPDRVWEGVLTRYSRRSSDNNLTFTATILLENKDLTILSGITAKVKLLRNSYENYIVLPTDVVINENGKNYVMLLNDNRVSKKEIVLGVSNVERCVVLSGVTDGDVLIEEGLQLLVDNQEVTVIEEGV